ncbi:hypothetical protein Tco_0880698 [Tanacetum coccineum]
MVVMEYHECLGGTSEMLSSKGSNLGEVVSFEAGVKFEVLIEKKKMCSLGLMRFSERKGFRRIHGKRFEEDEDEKKSGKDGIFN